MSDPTPIELLNSSVLADAPMFAFVLRSDDTCAWTNRYTAKHLGLPTADLECEEPFPLPSLVPTADEAELKALCRPEQPFDLQVETAPGETTWIAFRVQELRLELRLIIGDDCTQRKLLEQQVREERSILRRLVDVIPYDVLWTDSDLRYIGCNESHATRVGSSHIDDVVGRVVGEPTAATEGKSAEAVERAHAFLAAAQRVLNSGQPLLHQKVSYLGQDGELVHNDVCIVPLADSPESHEGVLAIIADETERVRMEHQILQASKLEAVGQLAAGLAHEINTPVQFVSDNLRFMEDSSGDIRELLQLGLELAGATSDADPATRAKATEFLAAAEAADLDFLLDEIPSALSQSLEGTDRIAKLVRAMKDFSHPGGSAMEAVDVNSCISSTVTVATSEWKYVADVQFELADDLPTAHGSAAEINQVILNLVVNAAHAIADVRHTDPAAARGVIGVSTRHIGDCVEIRISDTGTGIPAAVKDKIFDPFFSTKEVGKGTGQGLAIAHDIIVNKHCGAFTLTTEEGVGTEFTITLPTESVARSAEE